MKERSLKPFFKSDLLIIVDAMCRRYKKLPSEILDLSLEEFNFNVAIFLKAIRFEKQEYDKRLEEIKKHGRPIIKGDHLSFGGFNIHKIKKRKGKS